MRMIVNLTKATTHKALIRTEGANDLQSSLTVEVLPSNNSKNGSLCRSCIKWEIPLVVARSYNVWRQKMASKKVVNRSVLTRIYRPKGTNNIS